MKKQRDRGDYIYSESDRELFRRLRQKRRLQRDGLAAGDPDALAPIVPEYSRDIFPVESR